MSSIDIVSSKIASIYLPDSHPWSIMSISPLLPVVSSSRSHDVCMLDWLLIGEGDIWAANYYILSCSIPLTTPSLSLNISGQDCVPLSEGEKEKESFMNQSVMLSMLLTSRCVTRHVIWNYGLKELTFNLDATILHRKLSVLYLFTWCWVTLKQPCEWNSYITSSHGLTKNVLVFIIAALIKTTAINYNNSHIFYDNSDQVYLVKNFPSS